MRKKAQEEIVGFVLIMVIVAVVLLIFLGITIRQDTPNIRESNEIYQFLESAMEFTTDCEIRFEGDFSSLGELPDECRSGTRCLNGENSCGVFNNTISKILDSSFNINADGTVGGYIFSSYYSSNLSERIEENEILNLEKGLCGSIRRGATYIAPSFPGRIVNKLDICFNI